ncbi:MAG: Rpn family recombination-promoting nuclease/putative transposase [Bacteroidales bacterium]|nr:Rpn family recombination-promoting nuclease/putative transposase [Bacteroidales bacterium]MCM1424636.1 Rpn family recombination-promoting nuclease/putative transposase [bacterium]
MNKNDNSQIIHAESHPHNVSCIRSDFEAATGKIPYNMTNDYMFRAVLQSSNKALRGLICSLLHLTESEVRSVAITNPILLGNRIDSKEFRLDIHLLLNNRTRVNLEMQIANRLNWQNRSVMYLCRSYDQLNRGQDYKDAAPAVHIGLLDYTLFQERPEFYAAYKLVNIKSYQVYSDSLTLYVADLSRIDLATEEDKYYHIDRWAKLFKAATWEELRMTASEDEALYAAAKALFYQSSDEDIRMRCRDREEYYQDMRNYERKIEQDRIEYEQDIQNYKRTIEQDRLQHEQDIHSYEETIEQNRLQHEQDIRSYEETIEQDRLQHEQDIRSYEETIARLQQEIAQLKKGE